MNNPYVIDRPLTDRDLFRGREALFARLGSGLREGQRLFTLCGKPHIGKTSFVNQLGVRLGERYHVRYIPWPSENTDIVSLGSGEMLWRIATTVCRELEIAPPDRVSFEAGAAFYLADILRMPIAEASGPVTLLCLDALYWGHADELDEAALRSAWAQIVSALSQALSPGGALAILLVIDGAPVGDGLPWAEDPRVGHLSLGPFTPDESEELLTLPVRGTMTFDYESILRIHRRAGGEPFFVQLYGHVLFERRSRAGWVGVAEVDRATEEVIALGAPQFQEVLDHCTPVTRIVLCAFAEMIGHHGVGSVEDVSRHLARRQLEMPLPEIEAALAELVRRDILTRLGGETYRFGNELLRRWLKAHHPPQEAVRQLGARQARRFYRSQPRTVLPLRTRRIDWLTLLLWSVVGVLIVGILLVWRTRITQVLWTGEPTLPALETTAAPTMTMGALPTPVKGVAPGHIAYMFKENAQARSAIFVMRSDGSDPLRLTDGQANDTSPVWSPDGRRIVFVSDRDGNREVYVMNADGNEQLNLSNHPAEDWTPTWSPDGQRIAFASFRDGNWEIYVMDADGANQTRLTQNEAADYSPSWSPNGETIAFVSNRDGNWEIYLMAPDGSAQRRFTDDPATDGDPAWSPDGTALLWESYREGNMEIYMARLDGSAPQNLSRDAYADDHGPTWSPWGRRIAFFSNRDGGWDIYTLDLETGERINLTLCETLEQRPSWGP